MIKSYFSKFCVLREKKWVSTIIKFVFKTTSIHIKEHLHVWKMETVYIELSPTKPSTESGWTSPEVSLGYSRSKSEHLTQMLIGLRGEGPLSDRAL